MGNAPRSSQNEVISVRIPQSKQIHTTSISMVPDTELDVHVHRNSFKLSESPEGYCLTFKFDTLNICLITIYYFGVEVLNQTEDHSLYFAVDTSKYPAPNSYKFPKGLNTTFPENVSKISLSYYMNDIEHVESYNQYHIIVTIKSEGNNAFPYESSFLKIEKDRETWKPVLIKQKIHFQNSSFNLNEIYGLSAVGGENECVVCLTGQRSVSLMPCKHLCLCKECASVLAEAVNKRCPMCRSTVNELLFIQ